jgi:hypothetical protein
MCLLRETGEENGLLGQGVLGLYIKIYMEMADAGLDLYLPFIYWEKLQLAVFASSLAALAFLRFFM